MADKRIFNLTEASTAGDNDLLALDNSNFPETKKIKISKLRAGDAQKLDITDLYNLTGTTNTTGSTIHKGTFFYLNGSLSVALADIAAGATFTFDTNYTATTVGDELADVKQTLSTQTYAPDYYYDPQRIEDISSTDCTSIKRQGNVVTISVIAKTLVTLTSSQTTIFKIPEEITPSKKVNAIAFLDNQPKRLEVNSNGNVNLHHEGLSTTGNQIYGSVTYNI